MHRPDAVFILMSTNKVYGDAPERAAAGRAADALGLRATGGLPRHRRDLPHRPLPALASSARARSPPT